MTAKTIALINQKGGVGKTTTTFHLARAAVKKGRKVLVVDVDPQGNLTLAAAAEGAVTDGQVGLADVLSKRADEGINDVIVEGVWPNLFVVPTTGEALGDVRDELVVSGAGREMRLREALKQVKEDYDLIFLDCPPSLDQLTVNALCAADEVVVVTKSKLFSAAGLSKIMSTVEVVQQSYHPALKIAGIILNEHEENTISGRHWRAEIDTAKQILNPPIPKAAVISDAVEAATGLDEWGGARARGLARVFASYVDQIEGKK